MKKKRETVERESYQEKDILKIDEIPVFLEDFIE